MRRGDPRVDRAARTFLDSQDRQQKRYFHLVDGGISDNLGLRVSIDFVTAAGGAEAALDIQEVETPNHLAVIVVNAEVEGDSNIDLSNAAPSLALLLNTVSGSQIRRYNFETLLLAEELLHRWGRELSTLQRPVTTHMVNVAFAQIDDAEERQYFNRIPTNFSLSDEEVDRVRAVGRRLLRESPDFQQLVRELR